ncbi:hypothetical protein MA16_Dca000613 [Dendrobium catenatum]|uniref:Uncharacterized protein n=1 Tax=Dendrobium catenatum TaxID=906689 RepID=A0A2I0WUD1_9ASPA|nr:hypothetical protein MA16_Dca000613 [Dendrobium catenatum]
MHEAGIASVQGCGSKAHECKHKVLVFRMRERGLVRCKRCGREGWSGGRDRDDRFESSLDEQDAAGDGVGTLSSSRTRKSELTRGTKSSGLLHSSFCL